MSIYQPKNGRTPFYWYDFVIKGQRFHGSTKATNKPDAKEVEKAERKRAKETMAQAATSVGSLRMDDVAQEYWQNVGQYHVGAKDTDRQLERLVEFFGPDTLLTDITNADVTRLVAWRRSHRVIRSKKRKPEECPFISPYTVNDTTEQLKKLFNRKRRDGVRFQNEPKWREQMLQEPEERVRELHGDERPRIDAEVRADWRPFFDFAQYCGHRDKSMLHLRWTEVHWDEGEIRKKSKGGRTIVIPLTPTLRRILEPLCGHHSEFVFTYVAQRTAKGRIRGHRYPLTQSGRKSLWKGIIKHSGVKGFRFHDYRHDVGTKMLRETGNLKLVQRTLGHADIATTARYAHVTVNDVAAGLEKLEKSRKKSRSAPRKVG